MKLILKSGTVIEDDSYDVATWKEVLKSPTTVQYSNDKGEVILFNSSEIREIYFSAEDVKRSMQDVVP
jgi:hypothetical protein